MTPPADENFEFAALNAAANYRRALLQEFGPFLRGDVLEVGAGIGQLSEAMARLPQVKRLHAVEPNPGFFKELVGRGLPIEATHGTVTDVPAPNRYDAIVSVNVLEHIEDDADELKRYQGRLRPGGKLCLFVPACPSIYAPMDEIFGHFRRYTKCQLQQRLIQAGFTIEQLFYYNSLGYLAWGVNFRLLKKRTFEIEKVRFYDKVLFPFVHACEHRLLRPPIGQSLLAIARA